MIVVDTNILAHFWLPSDSTDLCDLLFQKDPQWVAPILWRSEFRNVVTLYLRKELIDLAQALLIMEKAELQMKDQQFQVNSVQVLHHVSYSTCSSYDCEFVSLAKDLDLELVTMDNQILQEFPDIAKHPKNVVES
ncbi:type II toxin-antitoxin system VapC family toxin [Rhodohalobacter barkolensis]|uniref:VapC toxin family PIN domain ribonuclease n=1 Tax=Rhodohalobacter barkolensis TaxID=2053187 RepID=A0A2N0VF12_9BACT|nr:type II toxin-antitoxin system VapC family toxin [Rhodohalobacter barkolensis]PKD42773.1 VapC toxin family PIN domain ribonuclease [Rhodohalobacter barkolensis]